MDGLISATTRYGEPMKMRKLVMAAVACVAVTVSGEVVESGELDITQQNDFWDCRGHSCPVSRESVSATVKFAGGCITPSAAAVTVDSWLFTRLESNACPIDSFPVGFLLFFR